MKDDRINIFYSEEDKGYIADIPDLKYCSAVGATVEEAVREVLNAKAAWLEAAKSEGKPNCQQSAVSSHQSAVISHQSSVIRH